VTADRAGLRLLYVTITRATKTLTIVHAEPLPEALVGA
jgi:DNA helicase IV